MRPIPLEEIDRAAGARARRRNERQVGVDWTFAAEGARVKLKRIYPKIKRRSARLVLERTGYP